MFGREAKNWITFWDISKFNQAVKVQNCPVPSVNKSLARHAPTQREERVRERKGSKLH
jgi:hypothetical protein